MADRPRVLIEDWLPVTELGIESRREAAPIPGQFPKLKTLHVWWARRPLVASAGAVLGSVMPGWSEALAEAFPDAPELESEKAYKSWFMRLCGILGDPVASKRALDIANARGERLPGNGYGYSPAFKNSPSVRDLELLSVVLKRTWGRLPNILDPTAGGGSIPYEAIRYGLPTIANDLNPVAAFILEAGVEIPARFGVDLLKDLRHWGEILVARLNERLLPFFELQDQNEVVLAYLFARTVVCPRTGKAIPLAPHWWLSKATPRTAVRLVTERGGRELPQVQYEIVSGEEIDFDPDRGTSSGGDAVSPWDGLPVNGDYIKAEALSGRMGSQLYAVAIRTRNRRRYRAPTATDLEALASAETQLASVRPHWITSDILPSESVPNGNDPKLHIWRRYWTDMFTPRQLLVHGTFVEEYRQLIPEVQAVLSADRANAILLLLGLMQGKALDYNSRQCTWDLTRDRIGHGFEQHAFPFRSTHTEFKAPDQLYPWVLEQLLGAYRGIAELLVPRSGELFTATSTETGNPGAINVMSSNAANLQDISDSSISLVCIDPPYYDNVWYAELSDFFYVWQKRTIGLFRPNAFSSELTDKKNEAVVSPIRFADAGPRKKQLAAADYEAKMTAIFAECHRVLVDEGVLTIMFTHKKAEAWDTLGTGLMEAGFAIETSWPVNTESEQSRHQAKKNSAQSTILLVCRKRESTNGQETFFEDLEAEVRKAARDAIYRFQVAGLSGVDLLLATYGPALSVISSRWPVYSSEADELTGRARLLRPEEALDAARAEVVRSQRRRLVGRAVQLDPLSDFALIAWDTFKAAEFPFDEGRRLALAIGGLDIDELAQAKLVGKKAGTVVLLPPAKRVRRSSDELPGVRVGATAFACAVDAVHTVIYVADVDGLPAAKALIDRAGLARDGRFLACLQGLVNAIPRTRVKGAWVRPEAETLDRLCAAYFPDVEIPPDPMVVEPLTLDL
jgi:putative DNA methylase